ncbi:MAG: hypothetical protein ACLFOY_06200 [Desulfatibacillaceae bacterium]
MSDNKITYVCEICGSTVDLDEQRATPECCGQRMKQDQEVCLKKPTGEQYRFQDEDEPCDDSTEGVKR